MSDVKRRKDVLYVRVKAEDLVGYVINATESTPKKFRNTFVKRMQDYAIDVLENIVLANNLTEKKERIPYMDKAFLSLQLLDSFARLSEENKLLTEHQFVTMSKMIAETLNYLLKWKASTIKVSAADSSQDIRKG